MRAGSSLGFMRPLVDLRGKDQNCSQTQRTSQPGGQSIQSRGGLQCSSGLHPGPSFRRRGMMGGGPEPLALILARVGCPHVLPSLHLLQTVLVHFPLGEDEEKDTTGEADGPRGGEMCTGFGEGPRLSQKSCGESHSNFIELMNTAIPLVSISVRAGGWRAP